MPRQLEVDCEEANHEEDAEFDYLKCVVERSDGLPHRRMLALCMEFPFPQTNATTSRRDQSVRH
jgi:hypothetical protein